jgi:hypothetical protein
MSVKERYEKPDLGVIELKAEEVLAVGCKSPGPKFNVGLSACGVGVPCVSTGS